MPANSAVPTEPPQTIKSFKVNTGTSGVSHVIFLDKRDHLLAICGDKFYVVKNESMIDEHSGMFTVAHSLINDIALLENGVVVFLSYDSLATWRPDGRDKLGLVKLSHSSTCFAKLDESKIIIGDREGGLTLLIRETGTSFRVDRSFPNSHGDRICDIAVHGDLFVTCSDDNTAKVWDTNSLTLKATFPHRGTVRSAAMSDKYIVISWYDRSVKPSEETLRRTTVTVVQYPGDQCDELFELPVYEKFCYPSKVAFLNDDVIVLAMNICLIFISISKESVLSRVEMDTRIFSFDVASDGRIAVCGKNGFCAVLTPPKSVQGAADATSSTERRKIQAPTPAEDDPDVAGLIAKLTISEESQGAVDDCVTPLCPSSSIEDSTSPGRTATLNISEVSEMVRWKATGVSKNSVQELESGSAAACFVAFLLNYEIDSEEMFCQLKDTVKKVFKKNMIYGASFVEAEEEEKKVLIDVLMTALKDVTDEVATKLMEMWVKKFIRLAGK